MSSQELHRVEVLARVKNRNLKLKDAAALLRLSHRQVKRLWKRYRKGGGKALQRGNAEVPASGIGAGAQEIFRRDRGAVWTDAGVGKRERFEQDRVDDGKDGG